MNVFGTFLASYGKLPRQELEIPTHETNMNMKTDRVPGGRERNGAIVGRSRLPSRSRRFMNTAAGDGEHVYVEEWLQNIRHFCTIATPESRGWVVLGVNHEYDIHFEILANHSSSPRARVIKAISAVHRIAVFTYCGQTCSSRLP